MRIKDIKNRVESSEVYKNYKKKNSESFSAHIFIDKKKGEENWQIGYFNPKNKIITSFSVYPTVNIITEDKALSKTGNVPEIELENIAVEYPEAEKVIEKVLIKEYNIKYDPIKTQMIIILQIIEQPVWNITVITNDFNIINIRVDAMTKDVITHRKQSLMGLGEFIPGKK